MTSPALGDALFDWSTLPSTTNALFVLAALTDEANVPAAFRHELEAIARRAQKLVEAVADSANLAAELTTLRCDETWPDGARALPAGYVDPTPANDGDEAMPPDVPKSFREALRAFAARETSDAAATLIAATKKHADELAMSRDMRDSVALASGNPTNPFVIVVARGIRRAFGPQVGL